MISAIAVASIGLAAVALWLSGVVAATGQALKTMRSAYAVIGDESLDDLARETAVQRAALALMGTVFSILWRAFLVFAASAVPVLLALWAGLAAYEDLMAFLVRWEVIAGATVVLVAPYFAKATLCRSR